MMSAGSPRIAIRDDGRRREPTIWRALALKLGREPTNEEARAEVRRILRGDAA
jgi:hypothetical protein